MGPTASKVAEWIKVEMKNLGITQADIQRRLIGRSHGYVSERVSGKRSWGISELDSLAPLFHMQDAVDLVLTACGKNYEERPERTKSEERIMDPEKFGLAAYKDPDKRYNQLGGAIAQEDDYGDI